MANSHTGTSTPNTLGGQFDVFLSFCGCDTRIGFANTVYYALSKAGFHVFIDEEELKRGERISDNLPEAIDNSKIYIPIFSTNYASRHWCLRELAKMVENASKSKEDGDKKVILPIFYNVSVDDVKLKTQIYSDAISNLEQMTMDQRKRFDPEDIASWRQALKNVGGISGSS